VMQLHLGGVLFSAGGSPEKKLVKWCFKWGASNYYCTLKKRSGKWMTKRQNCATNWQPCSTKKKELNIRR
jgi:hypothetical protein